MKLLLLVIIKIYQKTLSPDHGLAQNFFPQGACRYHPTCSQYAIDAIRKFGAINGAFLSAKRLMRCHPWSKGGWDPVKNKQY